MRPVIVEIPSEDGGHEQHDRRHGLAKAGHLGFETAGNHYATLVGGKLAGAGLETREALRSKSVW
jgi:hypothetical protein